MDDFGAPMRRKSGSSKLLQAAVPHEMPCLSLGPDIFVLIGHNILQDFDSSPSVSCKRQQVEASTATGQYELLEAPRTHRKASTSLALRSL